MKALGLAVAARRVGPGADMANADLLEAAVGGVARSAEPLSVMIRSTMTPAFEPAERPVEEGDGAILLLIGQELGGGEPRGVVDADRADLRFNAIKAGYPCISSHPS